MAKQQDMGKPIYKDASKSVESRVEDLLSRMTLEEKIAQLGSIWSFEVLDNQSFSKKKAATSLKNGIGQITRVGGATILTPENAAKISNDIQKYCTENTRFGIPAIMHEECCSGLMTRNASLFPQALGIAAAWNPELIREMTQMISKQMKSIGAHQGLAPVLDVTRDPRWGRTEETLGEDPYLTAKLGCAYIKGLQEADDGKITGLATAKHFVGYGAAEGGKNWAPTNISERELHETYLFPFEAAIKEAGLVSIMNSYCELNGEPCCSSKTLLKDILRKAWEFNGIIVSDYFSINMLTEYHETASNKMEAAVQAIEAGIDVELPSGDCYKGPLQEAIDKKLVEEAQIDELVKRTLKIKFNLGLFENPYVDVEKTNVVFQDDSSRLLSKRLASESIILLKNDGILPLEKSVQTIAVIGPSADDWRNMIGDYAYPCHIESLAEMKDKENTFDIPISEDIGDISGAVKVVTLFESLQQQLSPATKVLHAKGCGINDGSDSGIAEAVSVANQADLAIVVVGDKSGLTDDCTSGEARDSATLKLPGVQENLLQAMIRTSKPVILVLISGRPYQLTAFQDKISAIIYAGLPGEEGGNAIADVLLGQTNPSAKLPISYPRSVGQIPVFYSHKPSGGRSHWKGSYIDESEKPLYPFGFGLSYTTFEFKNIKLDQPAIQMSDSIRINFEVTNTGKLQGTEVVQLYVRYKPKGIGLTRPVKELKGFCRISLNPGETKGVVFTLFASQLSYYKENLRYAIAPGAVEVMIGSSSQDIHLHSEFDILGKEEQTVTNRAFFSTVKID